MNDEKEVEKIDRLARRAYDLCELDKCNQRISMSEEKERLIERIVEIAISHGKSCYEKGGQDGMKFAKEHTDYLDEVWKRDGEITRLKERVKEAEQTHQVSRRELLSHADKLEMKLKEAEKETEKFKGKWAKYVDHFWCDCGLTDEQRDKGEDCTFEGTKTCGYCMDKIQKRRIKELNDRLANSWAKKSAEEIETAIHQSRAWQALYLELQAEILADAKKHIATDLVKFMEQGKQ